jgi:hypothetical protein
MTLATATRARSAAGRQAVVSDPGRERRRSSTYLSRWAVSTGCKLPTRLRLNKVDVSQASMRALLAAGCLTLRGNPPNVPLVVAVRPTGWSGT